MIEKKEDLKPEDLAYVQKQVRLCEKHWYALFVDPLHELRLWEYFTGQRCPDRRHAVKKDRSGVIIPDPALNPPIEAYVPYRLERRQWSDRVKKIPCLLAPGLIFVHIRLREPRNVATEEQSEKDERKEDDRIRLLSSDPHVRRFLCNRELHEPAPISDDAMDIFMKYVQKHPDVSISAPEPGQTVRVLRGTFAGRIGKIVGALDDGKAIFQVTLVENLAFKTSLSFDDFVIVPKDSKAELSDV